MHQHLYSFQKIVNENYLIVGEKNDFAKIVEIPEVNALFMKVGLEIASQAIKEINQENALAEKTTNELKEYLTVLDLTF